MEYLPEPFSIVIAVAIGILVLTIIRAVKLMQVEGMAILAGVPEHFPGKFLVKELMSDTGLRGQFEDG